MRFAAVFIALCMVVIAGSAGAAAYLALAVSPAEALAAALATLSALVAWNAFSGRAQERAEFSRQVEELSRGTTELARQVGDLGRRVGAVEAAATRERDMVRIAIKPVGEEIEALGNLVAQIAERVAEHEAALAAQPLSADIFGAPAEAAPALPPAGEPPAPAAPAPPPPSLPAAPAIETVERRTPESAVRAAVANGRIALHLQPIVALPQRKIRHYEALAYLRAADGATLAPADYAAAAESGALMPAIDDHALAPVLQVAKRLRERSRDGVLFYGAAGATLDDPARAARLIEQLSANRPLASVLALGWPQGWLRAASPAGKEALAQIAALGFRFALAGMRDLAIDPRQLMVQGFRFVRAPASLLLDDSAAAAADIHPADLAHLLARFGIDLVVEAIDSESTVLELLDYGIRFGQGALFASPRPVRAETLQGAGETPSDAVPAAAPNADAPRPNRRRTADPDAPLRPGGERTPHGLANLARTLMRRA